MVNEKKKVLRYNLKVSKDIIVNPERKAELDEKCILGEVIEDVTITAHLLKESVNL